MKVKPSAKPYTAPVASAWRRSRVIAPTARPAIPQGMRLAAPRKCTRAAKNPSTTPRAMATPDRSATRRVGAEHPAGSADKGGKGQQRPREHHPVAHRVGLEQIVEREQVCEEEQDHRRREYGHRPLHHHSLRML